MTSLRRVSCGVLVSLTVLLFLASWAEAQDVSRIFGEETSEQQGPPIRPVRTDSPRDTLTTFLRLRNELEAACAHNSTLQQQLEDAQALA